MSKAGNWKDTREPQVEHKSFLFHIYSQERESEISGKKGTFQLVKAPDWINVVALTENNEVVLVKQFRHGTAEMTLELCGGACEKGEDPLVSAKRELEEETGYTSSDWESLGYSDVNPAFMNNRTWYYLARNCAKTSQQNLDPMEEIEVVTVPLGKIPEMIRGEEITHSLVHSAFLYYQLKGYSF